MDGLIEVSHRFVFVAFSFPSKATDRLSFAVRRKIQALVEVGNCCVVVSFVKTNHSQTIALRFVTNGEGFPKETRDASESEVKSF